MNIKQSVGLAIQTTRKIRNKTQEDFSEISSRTYISALERGLYSPTVEKIDALAQVIGIHPLTLLTLSYLIGSKDSDPTVLLNQIQEELTQFISAV